MRMGNKSKNQQYLCQVMAPLGAVFILAVASSVAIHSSVLAQSPKTPEPAIPVRYTDVRESAKITFQQDSTQTEEKYYLETM